MKIIAMIFLLLLFYMILGYICAEICDVVIKHHTSEGYVLAFMIWPLYVLIVISTVLLRFVIMPVGNLLLYWPLKLIRRYYQ